MGRRIATRSMHDLVQGRDTSVRGIISKGHFVQGAQHQRTFGWGHIGWGTSTLHPVVQGQDTSVSDGTSKLCHVQVTPRPCYATSKGSDAPEPHRQRDAVSEGPSETFRLGTLRSGTFYHVISPFWLQLPFSFLQYNR